MANSSDLTEELMSESPVENLNDPAEQLKSIAANLQKCVECPVCFKTLKPSFKLCVRGHAVCDVCTAKLEKCPLCQEIFTLENPIWLKNVLEALPHLCCYSDDGCTEIVEPRSDHETFCGYRPIDCPSCSFGGMFLVNFLSHYEKYHSGMLYIHETSIETPWWDLPGWTFPKPHLRYTLVFIFNNLFWIIEKKDSEGFKIDFQATPIGKLDHKYYASITFENGDFIYACTLKAGVEVLSSCFNKEKGYKRGSLDEQHCLKISISDANKLVDYNGYVNIKISFFDLPIANK